MLEKIVDISLKYKLLVIIFFMLVSIMGIKVYKSIPVDAFTDITPKQVIVYTESPGNSAEDIEKLKYLNRSLSRKRDCEGFTTEIYIQFIERFYNDTKFNELYNKWIETNDKWIKPSLDHIEAKCNGGSLLIDNLQFISWLENRAKVDIDQELWNRMKQNINYYL